MPTDSARAAVAAIADAAARWTNADFPPRVRAARAVAARTGYTDPVVDYALDALFGAIDRGALEAAIAGELGSLDALDAFVARRGRPDVSYAPVGATTIVSSDTTIGVAIPALVFALCAGARVHVKDRDDRLVAAFLATLAQESPALAERATSGVWDGDDAAAASAHLAGAAVVVAYGRTSTLAAIRARLRPDARFVPFGHRTSVGYVDAASLVDAPRARALALAVARDALLYDGDGCLSPHAVFVEPGGAVEPGAFAALLAAACDEIAVEFPAGYAERDAATAAYVRAARFRASQGAGSVFTSERSPHVVAFDAPPAEPPPLLRRTLAVYPVPDVAGARGFLERHALPLEAVGICDGAAPHVVAFARASGASRVAALGTLQRPPLGGEHGGQGRILPFVRAIYRA